MCGPFAARGLRGKKSTPSVGWEVPVGSWGRQAGAGAAGAGAAGAQGSLRQAIRQRYVISCRVVCIKLMLRLKFDCKGHDEH